METQGIADEDLGLADQSFSAPREPVNTRHYHADRGFWQDRGYLLLLCLATLAVLVVFILRSNIDRPPVNSVNRVDALKECVERFAPKFGGGAQTPDLNSAYDLCYRITAAALRAEEQQNRNENLAFQMSENVVLMCIVVIITTSGVVLSGLQLLYSYKLALKGKAELSDGGRVEFDKGKVVVQSSVIGVIILAISFAFFIIFVRDVYTIHDIVPELPATLQQPPVSSDVPSGNIGQGQKKLQPQE